MAVSLENRMVEQATKHINGITTSEKVADIMPAEGDGPVCAIDTVQSMNSADSESPVEFVGDVNTNNEIPSQATLRKVENFMLLDRDGRAIQFKDVYGGKHGARRVLVIFIRHFYCGVCFLLLNDSTVSFIFPVTLPIQK